MIDRVATVEELRKWLIHDHGLHQVRVDRFCLSEEPRAGDFNLEIGTVYGEVRVRVNGGGSQVGVVDIRSEAHLPNAKKRLAALINKGKGMTWVKGEGWRK